MQKTKFSLTKGTHVFTAVWFGQLISLTGSGLTNFALGVWVYQDTGSATQFALIALSSVLPLIFISPIAGALVDRWDRRKVMIVSDTGAALSTFTIVALFATGHLETWHIYLTTAASATFNTFQWPAYTAATTLLVPKKQLGRASGMTQFAEYFADLASPMLGAVLLSFIGLYGVVLLDLITFFIALFTLLLVQFPAPPTDSLASKTISSLFSEIAYGWHYIIQRPGLLALLFLFAMGNFFQGLFDVLMTPLILSFASPVTLGTILSVGGASMVVGSLVMSAKGGTRRLTNGIFIFQFFTGFCMLLVGLQTSVLLIAIFVFFLYFGRPIMSGSSQVIWQKKIPPDVQGRVFATRRMVSWLFLPLAFWAAGPLADSVFEPLLAADGALAPSIGQMIGTGPGRGIGLLAVLAGLGLMGVTAVGYLYRPLRLVEDEIPDVITAPTSDPPAPPEPLIPLDGIGQGERAEETPPPIP